MKIQKSIKFGSYITAKLMDNGVWYLTHPNRDGESLTYSTGITGSAKDIKKHIEEANIQQLVEVGIHTQLRARVIAQLSGDEQITWEVAIKGFQEWLESQGKQQSTIERLLYIVNRFIAEEKLQKISPRKVTERHVFHYVNVTLEGTKATTRDKSLFALRTFFRYTTGAGYTNSNPATITAVRRDLLSHDQKETKSIEAFTRVEIRRLLSAINTELKEVYQESDTLDTRVSAARRAGREKRLESRQRWLTFWKAAIPLAYGLGLRMSDVARLELASIGQAPGWIIVHTRKTNSRIAVPYTEETIEQFLANELPLENADKAENIRKALEDSAPWIDMGVSEIDVSDATYCFPEYHKNWNQALSCTNFLRTLERIGIKGKSFHSLRHSRIREWNKLNVDLEIIGKFVGHSSTHTTRMYLGND